MASKERLSGGDLETSQLLEELNFHRARPCFLQRHGIQHHHDGLTDHVLCYQFPLASS